MKLAAGLVAAALLVWPAGGGQGYISGRAPCSVDGRTTGQTVEETASYRIYVAECTYVRSRPDGPINYEVGGPGWMIHCKHRWVYERGVAGRRCPGLPKWAS